MTNEIRLKFFSLAHAVVSGMANEESLRDLFNAVMETPMDDWPKGAWSTSIAAVGITSTCGYHIDLLLGNSDEPILVTNTQEEKP